MVYFSLPTKNTTLKFLFSLCLSTPPLYTAVPSEADRQSAAAPGQPPAPQLRQAHLAHRPGARRGAFTRAGPARRLIRCVGGDRQPTSAPAFAALLHDKAPQCTTHHAQRSERPIVGHATAETISVCAQAEGVQKARPSAVSCVCVCVG